MELSQLAAYAREKFHMEEQFKWPDYPGISVLTEPKTGRQVALLIYEWDPETGTGIERVDIRCGKSDLSDMSEGIEVTNPFLKRGSDWMGLAIGNDTNETEVYHLLDRAVADCSKWNFSITLDDSSQKDEQSSDTKTHALLFHGTSIPPRQTDAAALATEEFLILIRLIHLKRPRFQVRFLTALQSFLPDLFRSP